MKILVHRFLLCLLFAPAALAQAPAVPGQAGYEANCGICHGGDGLGGEMGPNLSFRLANLSDEQLLAMLHDGIPARGMPAFPQISGQELTQLVSFLRTIRPKSRPDPVQRTVQLPDGKARTGLVINESARDLQLRTPDGRVHLLRPAAAKFREVTSQVDWTTYNGNTNANRFSTVNQITPANASRLAPKWIYTMEGATSRGETTPLVIEGIMYVASANESWALDAGSGREIWHF
jgi:alcohol dehydrogenase (cytochrome c)